MPGEKVSVEVQLALINQRLSRLELEVCGIAKKLDNQYVNQTEFRPVKLFVHGTIAFLLTSLLSGAAALAFIYRG